jgi:hypothetical protein
MSDNDFTVSGEYEPLTDRETVEPGDTVKVVHDPSPLATDPTPRDDLGEVKDVFVNERDLGGGRSREDEIAVIESESGETFEFGTAHTNQDPTGGKSLIPLGESGGVDAGMGGSDVFRGRTRPTDIGREPDGEYARPESDPDIAPASVARNTETGEFGLDPYDLTSGGIGEGVGLLSSGGTTESREIEYGGEQIDLTEQDTDDLESMNDFFKRNIDAEVEAERGRGGFGTSDFAQDMSSRQVEVATELDRRKR